MLYVLKVCISVFKVAGLDAGWGQRLDMTWDSRKGHYVLKRELPAGKYSFKLVYGDRWCLSPDHPTVKVAICS